MRARVRALRSSCRLICTSAVPQNPVLPEFSELSARGRWLSTLAVFRCAIVGAVTGSMRRDDRTLLAVYERLRGARGHAGWRPGETPFEVCLGAILTQNTSWSNVDKALGVLRRRGRFSYEALARCRPSRIAPLIRSSGYFNVKARRLAAFLRFLGREYGGR